MKPSVRGLFVLIGTLVLGIAASGCGGTSSTGRATDGRISVVGAENEYADVLAQVGGSHVSVTAIMSDPATDPHSYEASADTAKAVHGAALIVQNGLGYDDFVQKLEGATSNPNRHVIDVQKLLGLADDTSNPHLWYRPDTMPKVADEIATQLGSIDPAHKDEFAANAATFKTSLQTWTKAMAALAAKYPGAPVATTEPVADYLLDASGLKNLTPSSFQAALMQGTDPSPQDVATVKALITGHKVKVFVYNNQVTSSLTRSIADLATANSIPIVGVYETMPTPGFTYQSWMEAEVKALDAALGSGTSSPKL